jgi:hypothetical protein
MSIDFCPDAPVEDPFGGWNGPHLALSDIGKWNDSLGKWCESDPQALLIDVGHQSDSC